VDEEIRTLEREALGNGDPYAADPVACDTYLRTLSRMGRLSTVEQVDDFRKTIPAGVLMGKSHEIRSRLYDKQRTAKRAAEVAAIKPGDMLMRFSPCGPCLMEGRVTKITKAMIFYVENDGTEQRVSKKNFRIHAVGCHSCPGGANYPHGYMD